MCSKGTQGMRCGGVSDVKPITPEVQQLADLMKPDIEEMAKKTFGVFVVKAYKSQIVSGTNHFFKIHVGGNDYLHAKVYEELPCTGSKKSVTGLETNKSHDEELIYF